MILVGGESMIALFEPHKDQNHGDGEKPASDRFSYIPKDGENQPESNLEFTREAIVKAKPITAY
jgi:hypothetical protein